MVDLIRSSTSSARSLNDHPVSTALDWSHCVLRPFETSPGRTSVVGGSGVSGDDDATPGSSKYTPTLLLHTRISTVGCDHSPISTERQRTVSADGCNDGTAMAALFHRCQDVDI